MIESVSHIGSKVTACCHFMQSVKSWLIPSKLAAGANRKIAHFCENDLCNSNGSTILPAFLPFSLFHPHPHFKKLALPKKFLCYLRSSVICNAITHPAQSEMKMIKGLYGKGGKFEYEISAQEGRKIWSLWNSHHIIENLQFHQRV